MQRDPVTYEADESATATARGLLSPDVRLLAGTGSRYNAAPNSVLVADFRPNSAVVRTSATEELRGSWISILERNTTSRFAVLGFTDAAGEQETNQQLRADRARSVAALLPGTARRGVVGAAPTGDFVMPANSTREERALNRSVLIRLPPEELRQEAQVDEYSADAVAFWRSRPTSSVDELVTHLNGQVTALLDRNGVPKPDLVKDTVPKGTSTLAFFNAEDWTVTVDLTALAGASGAAGVTPATRMSDLSLDALVELSHACYHEARHAEQSFLAARVAAEDASGTIDSRTLSRSIGIREDIAQAAIAASATVLPDVLRTKANAWRTFMQGGRYIPYKAWNEKLKNNLDIFLFVYADKIDEWAQQGAGEIQVIWERGLHPPIDKTFRRDLLAAGEALRRSIDADPHSEPVDAAVKQTLANTVGRLFIMLAKERGGSKLPDFAALAKMSADDKSNATYDAQIWLIQLKIALLEASKAATDAYRSYPNEADAYEVGDAVKQSVRRQGGSTP